MGAGERMGRVLSKQEKEKDLERRMLADSLTGPVLPFDAYSGRCPKCSGEARKSTKKQWCPGSLPVRDDENICFVDGQHLHVRCEIQVGGCGFEWREECRDADEVPGSARAE